MIERGIEAFESTPETSGLRDLVKTLLRELDLICRRGINGRIERGATQVVRDVDELAPDCEIVDGAAIIYRIDDCRRFGRKAGERTLGDAAVKLTGLAPAA